MAIACRDRAGSAAGPGVRRALTLSEQPSTELGAAGARPERGESADGDTTARRDRRGARVVIGRMHVA